VSDPAGGPDDAANPYRSPQSLYLGDQVEVTAEGDVVFQMSAAEVARGYALGLRGRVLKQSALMVVVGLALLGYVGWRMRAGADPDLLIAGMGLWLLLMPVLTLSVQRRSVHRVFRDLGVDDEEIRLLDQGERGFELILEKQRAIIDRDNVVAARETGDFFLLYRTPTVIHVLPKDRLGSAMCIAIRRYFDLAGG